MTMIDEWRMTLASYLPSNTKEAVIRSGIYGLGIVSLLSGDIDKGINAGGVSMVASLISALSCSLFKVAFKNENENNLTTYCCKVFFDLAVTSIFFKCIFGKNLEVGVSILFTLGSLAAKVITSGKNQTLNLSVYQANTYMAMVL